MKRDSRRLGKLIVGVSSVRLFKKASLAAGTAITQRCAPPGSAHPVSNWPCEQVRDDGRPLQAQGCRSRPRTQPRPSGPEPHGLISHGPKPEKTRRPWPLALIPKDGMRNRSGRSWSLSAKPCSRGISAR